MLCFKLRYMELVCSYTSAATLWTRYGFVYLRSLLELVQSLCKESVAEATDSIQITRGPLKYPVSMLFIR